MKLHELLSLSPVAIQCHNVPDEDALASGFVLFRYFERAGKNPLFFYAGPTMTKSHLRGMVSALSIPVQHRPDMGSGGGHREKEGGYIAGNAYRRKFGFLPVQSYFSQCFHEY